MNGRNARSEASSETVMVRVASVLPAGLKAVAIYVAGPATAKGVPLMTPVLGFRVRPAGRSGLTKYWVPAAPVPAGLLAVIGFHRVYVAVAAV
jgi:hypothetical protein